MRNAIVKSSLASVLALTLVLMMPLSAHGATTGQRTITCTGTRSAYIYVKSTGYTVVHRGGFPGTGGYTASNVFENGGTHRLSGLYQSYRWEASTTGAFSSVFASCAD